MNGGVHARSREKGLTHVIRVVGIGHGRRGPERLVGDVAVGRLRMECLDAVVELAAAILEHLALRFVVLEALDALADELHGRIGPLVGTHELEDELLDDLFRVDGRIDVLEQVGNEIGLFATHAVHLLVPLHVLGLGLGNARRGGEGRMHLHRRAAV